MTKILFRNSVLALAVLAVPSLLGGGDALALTEEMKEFIAGTSAMNCISKLVKPDGELSRHNPEFAELSKGLKQVSEDFKRDTDNFRKWKQAFEEKRCDPDHRKPGTVWDAECEDILKSMAIVNNALKQDQALFAKLTQKYVEYTQTHFDKLDKQVGNLQRWCSNAKFGKGPDAGTGGESSGSPDSKPGGEPKAEAEKPKQVDEETATKPSDAEQATESDDQGDNETIEDTEDEADVPQGPTEGELDAIFPDPDKTEVTATKNNGAATKPGDTGDDEDISKACATNPNCELLPEGVSQEPADTDDQAAETTDDGNGVTAEPDGDNIGTTDDTAEDNSATSEPDHTEDLTDDNSGESEATDEEDTAATEPDNTDDSSEASEPDTTEDNTGTAETDPDEDIAATCAANPNCQLE